MIQAALWVASAIFLAWVAFIALGALTTALSRKSPDYSKLTHDEVLVQHGKRYVRQQARVELIQKLECGHPMGAGRPADEYSSEPYCAWCRQCRAFLEEIKRLEALLSQNDIPPQIDAASVQEAREHLTVWMNAKNDRDMQANLEQQHKKIDGDRREREAREYLVLESERFLKEREQRAEENRSRTTDPSEVCKCGYPGCLGHEVINSDGPADATNVVFPGLTSAGVMVGMAERGIKFARFDVAVSGVPGNMHRYR